MREFSFDNVRIQTSDHWSDVSFWFLPDDEGMKPRVLAPNEEEYMEILLYPNRQISNVTELSALLDEAGRKQDYPPQKFDLAEHDDWVAASFKDEIKERFHRIWWLCRKNTALCLLFHGGLKHYRIWLKELDGIVGNIKVEEGI
jgi:hypothetical protein